MVMVLIALFIAVILLIAGIAQGWWCLYMRRRSKSLETKYPAMRTVQVAGSALWFGNNHVAHNQRWLDPTASSRPNLPTLRADLIDWAIRMPNRGMNDF